ncbi:uncharacterized protein [Rutidosis leptorrhynchoides]|uniref:uncharacterized protein n=1 Tax=Rutidosis leptorrhynchoides TaxID=125765 RepID=UPI003A99655B
MTSDHEELKHRRSSDDESKEPSKRRKHRHYRRRHHHHHSKKHEDKCDEVDEQVTDMPPPPFIPPTNLRSDNDMEEGEIVEEAGDDAVAKKIVDSDAESGEIKMYAPEKELCTPPPVTSIFRHTVKLFRRILKTATTTDDDFQETNGDAVVLNKEVSVTKEHIINGFNYSSHKGSGYTKSHREDDYEVRDRKRTTSNGNYTKVHKESSSKSVDEKNWEDRSRSRSISRGPSHLDKHKEGDEYYYKSRKYDEDGEIGRNNRMMKDYRRVSRDYVRGGSSYNRHSRDRNYDDTRDVRGARDRGNDYKHHRHEDIDDYNDRSRKYDGQKDHSTKVDVDTKKSNREEVNEEVYEDISAMQVEDNEEEEEDLNRIKEESRRRRQAILEKYKNTSKPQSNETVNENSGDESVGRSPLQSGNSGVESGLGGGTPKILQRDRSNGDDIFGDSPPRVRETKERSNDMFSDDIFGESPAGVRKNGKVDNLPIQRSGPQDNWDDAEGYYSYRFGEILDSRYEVIAAHGKGVYSTVVRAKDLKPGPTDPQEVAIKIIRNNHKTYEAGSKELLILKKLVVGSSKKNPKKLVGAGLEDTAPHCVRFLSKFKYRNHLCLVFESLNMNLRQVLKKFGRNVGLRLTAVRNYAKQIFIALKHLRECGVLHTDIKPDNMLVNDAKNVLKLCDFGNAMFAGKNEITPYLVSRFYRAPEIILGLTYGHPVDMWSVGCCLFELYTGKVLFPGATNNHMLRLQMELKGSFPKKMLTEKAKFIKYHFDDHLNFVSIEEDPVTKKIVKRLVNNTQAKGIRTFVTGSPGEDPQLLANFKDLLEKIFILDPDKRISVKQARKHPFITADDVAIGSFQLNVYCSIEAVSGMRSH